MQMPSNSLLLCRWHSAWLARDGPQIPLVRKEISFPTNVFKYGGEHGSVHEPKLLVCIFNRLVIRLWESIIWASLCWNGKRASNMWLVLLNGVFNQQAFQRQVIKHTPKPLTLKITIQPHSSQVKSFLLSIFPSKAKPNLALVSLTTCVP